VNSGTRNSSSSAARATFVTRGTQACGSRSGGVRAARRRGRCTR
jgi:hypothetical protein